MQKLFTRCLELERPWEISTYIEKQSGYVALGKAVSQSPAAVIDEVRLAHLRGRGGAGFPAGGKWGFLAPAGGKPRYLVINADEGEPGTFKDRMIMEYDPHRLIEGIAISAYALQVSQVYIFVRGELRVAQRRLAQAIADAEAQALIGVQAGAGGYKVVITVHSGAGAYICGEETALLESLEGRMGRPRMKPPFPAVAGFLGCPTIVNNVETIAAVPTIVSMGGRRFRGRVASATAG